MNTPPHRDHAVQFYDDERFLVTAVSTYAHAGLAASQPVVIIATPAHRAAFVERLASLGVDAGRAERDRTLTLLDARDTLDGFMVGGRPDASRFEATVGALVKRRRVAFPSVPLRACGEMVDLLWGEANAEAALRLEALWNALATAQQFSMLCAYALSRFGGTVHAGGFAEVCDQHAEVRPAESWTFVDEIDPRGREVARLQQRARSLEAEIEHRKRLEQALRDALDEGHRKEALLQEAVRARDDFISIASHELRNPLHAVHLQILSLLHAAQRQELTSEWALARLGRTSDSITRLGRLLDNLLDVSRITAGRLALEVEDVDFGAVVQAVVGRSREQAGAVSLTLDVQSVTGRWDRLRLDQIITNLLSNALKYGAGHPVVVRLTGNAEVATLEVEDRGIGIDETQRVRLFTRFEHGVPSRFEGGFGLGLWITHQIVEAMGGTIAVSSEPGQGSVFSVVLPRHPESHARWPARDDEPPGMEIAG
jgi:signal transduction histidine kinase